MTDLSEALAKLQQAIRECSSGEITATANMLSAMFNGERFGAPTIEASVRLLLERALVVDDFLDVTPVRDALALRLQQQAPAVPQEAPERIEGENAVGLSIICRDCGTLVSGVEAGDKVRWVTCQTCAASRPALERLPTWLASEATFAKALYVEQDRAGIGIGLSIKAARDLAHVLWEASLGVGTPRGGEPATALPEGLTFEEVRRVNLARCNRWHTGGIEEWSPSDWAVALAGEVGEACNAIKKLRRVEDSIASINDPARQLSTRAEAVAVIGEELADALLYLDLVAARLGINLTAETVAKFNSVSEKYGFPERLRAASSSGGEPPKNELPATDRERMGAIAFRECVRERDEAREIATYLREALGKYDANWRTDQPEHFPWEAWGETDAGRVARASEPREGGVQSTDALPNLSEAAPSPVPETNESRWRRIAALAGCRRGIEVAEAVRIATDAVWDAGADHEYAEIVKREGVTETNAEAFHGRWLDAFALALEGLPMTVLVDFNPRPLSQLSEKEADRAAR